MIKQNLKQALSGISIGFDLSRDYGDSPYYLYFNHEDKSIRAQSLLVFTAMLGSWYGGHDVFYSQKYLGTITYYPHEPPHRIDDYLDSFLTYATKIKKEFPKMHTMITSDLFSLDQVRAFEISFPDLDKTLSAKMRSELFSAPSFFATTNLKSPTLADVLKEAGDERFYDY